MVAPFSEAVVTLEKGKYTKTPVKTQFGWHVILREDSRAQTPPPLEAVKEQLMPYLQRKKVQNMVETLRKQAKVEILVPLTDEPPKATDKAAETAKTAEKAVEKAATEAADKAAETAKTSEKTVEKTATEAADKVEETAKSAEKTVEKAATKAADKVEETAKAAEKAAKSAVKKTEKEVSSEPKK